MNNRALITLAVFNGAFALLLLFSFVTAPAHIQTAFALPNSSSTPVFVNNGYGIDSVFPVITRQISYRSSPVYTRDSYYGFTVSQNVTGCAINYAVRVSGYQLVQLGPMTAPSSPGLVTCGAFATSAGGGPIFSWAAFLTPNSLP